MSANRPSSCVARSPGSAPKVPSFVIQVQLFLQGRGSEAEDQAQGFRPAMVLRMGVSPWRVPSPGGAAFSLRAAAALGPRPEQQQTPVESREGTGQAAPAVCGAATGLLSSGRWVGTSRLLARSATWRANAAAALPAQSGGRAGASDVRSPRSGRWAAADAVLVLMHLSRRLSSPGQQHRLTPARTVVCAATTLGCVCGGCARTHPILQMRKASHRN